MTQYFVLAWSPLRLYGIKYDSHLVKHVEYITR